MKTEQHTKNVLAKIQQSDYISRDLSWIQFNYRVLDQSLRSDRTLFDRFKFLAISANNLDEFCSIRLGSLYNYIDFGKKRIDYSGLGELSFRDVLLAEIRKFIHTQNNHYINTLKPLFKENNIAIADYSILTSAEKNRVDNYFSNMVYPMLTPMLYDAYHAFPTLQGNQLLLGVVTQSEESGNTKCISFIQIPSNISRFYDIAQEDGMHLFIPIELIIIKNIQSLFVNVQILTVSLFRINRNADFTLDEHEDIESNFLEELKRKLQVRKKGRIIRIDTLDDFDPWIMQVLKTQWNVDNLNVISSPKEGMIDYTGLFELVNHKDFKNLKKTPQEANPTPFPEHGIKTMFETIKQKPIFLHHPYHSMSIVLSLLHQASEDSRVLSIKMTLYRVANESQVIKALLRAAENGKHVSVLFEVRARFDEENNLREASRLRKAGCFVIYGIGGGVKTHTKMLMIARKEDNDKVIRYIHLSTGNYNEVTSKVYSDIGMLTADQVYANDVSNFFNAITGYSRPTSYERLITSPGDIRKRLCDFIKREVSYAKKGLASGILLKLNSLQDKKIIRSLYKASQAGVPINLIIRGICCLRPGRHGLSENIQVISIVGKFLEHARVYYFHHGGDPTIYIGSADAMVRSFDRRVESLFLVENKAIKKQIINLLSYNLKDDVNAYVMNEDGNYTSKKTNLKQPFNMHEEFYHMNEKASNKLPFFEWKRSFVGSAEQ